MSNRNCKNETKIGQKHTLKYNITNLPPFLSCCWCISFLRLHQQMHDPDMLYTLQVLF